MQGEGAYISSVMAATQKKKQQQQKASSKLVPGEKMLKKGKERKNVEEKGIMVSLISSCWLGWLNIHQKRNADQSRRIAGVPRQVGVYGGA